MSDLADKIREQAPITGEMIIKADSRTGSTHMTDREEWGRLMAEQLAALSREVVLGLVGEREYPYGGHVTAEAGKARYPIIGGDETSAGLLLYAFVYEARWAGLKTAELCPRWKDLPVIEKIGWEELAKEIASRVAEPGSSGVSGHR